MSQTYDEYEKDYDQCLSRVRSFLSSHARSLTTLRECGRLLSQASRDATAMETLAKESGEAFRIAESKKRSEQEIAPLEQEVEFALRERETGEVTINRNRSELFSGSSYNAPNFEGDDNGQMMDALIQDSDDLLAESQALCAQSEEIGSGTLNTMGMQREQLHSAGEHLRGARSTVDQARSLLHDLNRKALRNKRFLYCVIATLIVANILVIIAKIKKK